VLRRGCNCVQQCGYSVALALAGKDSQSGHLRSPVALKQPRDGMSSGETEHADVRRDTVRELVAEVDDPPRKSDAARNFRDRCSE
jgi:hypothetical protein